MWRGTKDSKMISQAHQDTFALTTAKNKTYIEIGAYHPIQWSNTYRLEMNGWKGFSIEYNKSMQDVWQKFEERKNKVYWDDALTFDYLSAIKENNLSKHVGYLSCDIEPVENTFRALQRVIEQGISFDCITFEHDQYQSKSNYDPIVRKYLENQGYKVAVENVYIYQKKQKNYFETWFVNSDIKEDVLWFDQWKSKNL